MIDAPSPWLVAVVPSYPRVCTVSAVPDRDSTSTFSSDAVPASKVVTNGPTAPVGHPVAEAMLMVDVTLLIDVVNVVAAALPLYSLRIATAHTPFSLATKVPSQKSGPRLSGFHV